MSRAPARFWLSATAVAGGWALGATLLLGHDPRMRLLALWTSGVMAICFGVAGLISHTSPLGMKEVADAGSVREAIETRRRSLRAGGSGAFHANFAAWLIVTGTLLVALYFIAWGIGHA